MSSDTHSETQDNKRKANPEQSKKWREDNRERYLEYNKERNQMIKSDPVLYAKKLEQNRLSRKKRSSQLSEYDKQRDKLKVNARSVVRNRISRGTLTRQPCELCNDPITDAHHDDYTKPLDVRWLCRKHHKEIHNAK